MINVREICKEYGFPRSKILKALYFILLQDRERIILARMYSGDLAVDEKVIFSQAAQKCPDAGSRGAFHLPIRRAILRVASRRIRSDSFHAGELVSRPGAYLDVRRNDEG